VLSTPEGYSCRWSTLEKARSNSALSCRITSGKIELVTSDGDLVLTRTSAHALVGTLKNRLEHDPGAQTKIHLTRKPPP
jgi:hypothetical protein